ncbi:hypothetical protein D1631_00330 [Chryseobacterium nematophagum]|uniref:Uncharacterized protein n=2 Tax=Chryseobacterium nematophagum TaxID=2305228 RepID=A0A3M7TK80_9FLAO|nr:hypothetical protein D1631_00185 [Chryseobacterium nematophagum]RNA63987.1 hypothetical protein D1631_00330 [Chryseobacterium nematophagum]
MTIVTISSIESEEKPDRKKYMKNMIEIFDQNKWHWAFTGIESIIGMEYEVGTKRVERFYRDISKAGKFPLSVKVI